MDPTPTITALAPAPSTAKATSKPASFIENYVGELAAAAAILLEALGEFRDRGLTPRTKMAAGDLIAQLYRLRAFLVPTWDFDAIARAHGIAALRAADVSPATAEAAVDEVLTILGKLIHDNLN